MQKITPFLWFDNQAEEAAKFYVSVFKKSKIIKILRHSAAGPGPEGSVMTVAFKLNGQEFTALNGGPTFTLTPAISFVVHCKAQKDVDHYWKKLSKGGNTLQCGWLTDQYGVSWQIVPTVLLELLQSKNTAKAERVMKAMMGMIKLDIKEIEAAAAGPEKKRKRAAAA